MIQSCCTIFSFEDHCLSFFLCYCMSLDSWLLITSLVSSNSSCNTKSQFMITLRQFEAVFPGITENLALQKIIYKLNPIFEILSSVTDFLNEKRIELIKCSSIFASLGRCEMYPCKYNKGNAKRGVSPRLKI